MKKREYSKIILKENLKIDDKKKETKQRKKEREKKPDLKKKKVFPNFKPASNQTKIQSFSNYFYYKTY
jgi:hypothetical protein